MKFRQRFYQRLYGLLSLLLLLQECHPLIRNGNEKRAYKPQSKDTSNGFQFSSSLLKMKENQFGNNQYHNAPGGYKGDSSPTTKHINPNPSAHTHLKAKQYNEEEMSLDPKQSVINSSRNESIYKYRRSVKQNDEENDASISMETINEQLNNLSRLFARNQEDIETKVNSYIENCSSQFIDDLDIFGGIKSPSGITTRLMLSVLYTIANCNTTAMQIISDISEQIGNSATFDMLKAFEELTDDLQETSDQDPENSLDDTEKDDTLAAEESTFLSGFVAENILNTQEMLKLFDVLANNEEFENNTDLNEVLSELESFSLTELVDKPNYRWIQYPIASEMNSTQLGQQRKVDLLVERLNSNATKRLLREISVPQNLTSQTDILVIYDRASYKLLSDCDKGLAPTLNKYEGSSLPEQLWILDNGVLTNAASHLSLHIKFQENVSSIVLQRHTINATKWINFRGRLLYNSGNNSCYLDTTHSISVLSSPVNITNINNLSVRCDVQLQDVQLVIASFSDVNSPQTLALHQPESVDIDPISKRIGYKFMIFMFLLGYMFRYYATGVQSAGPTYNYAQQVPLENTFFIKHVKQQCKVLTAYSVEDKYQILFEDFAEDIIEYHLWYWKESQIINVATQAVLETNYLINTMGEHDKNYEKFFRIWTHENNTIQSFNKPNCELEISDSADPILLINCSNPDDGNLNGPWSFVKFDQPNFDNFQKVVCMFFIQTTIWPCEFISSSEMYAPSLTPLTDNIYSQLWYMSNGRLINIDLGLAITELKDDTNTTFIGMGYLTSQNLTTWYMMNGQIYPSSNQNSVLTIDMSNMPMTQV